MEPKKLAAPARLSQNHLDTIGVVTKGRMGFLPNGFSAHAVIHLHSESSIMMTILKRLASNRDDRELGSNVVNESDHQKAQYDSPISSTDARG
jgi:hypothetical protein